MNTEMQTSLLYASYNKNCRIQSKLGQFDIDMIDYKVNWFTDHGEF